MCGNKIRPFYAMRNQRQRSLLTQFLSKLACAFVNRYVSRHTYVIWFRNHPSLITQLACDYFARYTHRDMIAEKKKTVFLSEKVNFENWQLFVRPRTIYTLIHTHTYTNIHTTRTRSRLSWIWQNTNLRVKCHFTLLT